MRSFPCAVRHALQGTAKPPPGHAENGAKIGTPRKKGIKNNHKKNKTMATISPFKAATKTGRKITGAANKVLVVAEAALLGGCIYAQYREHIYGGLFGAILSIGLIILMMHLANKILALACNGVLVLIHGTSDMDAVIREKERQEREKKREEYLRQAEEKKRTRYRNTRTYYSPYPRRTNYPNRRTIYS